MKRFTALSALALAFLLAMTTTAFAQQGPEQLVGLGLADDGTLEIPKDGDDTGWYAGPAPGARSPAVIAGHVDSTTGPAVFYRLDDLKRGDTIEVIADSGTVTTFTVDRLKRFPKAQFPTRAVCGLTPDPQLRLITCAARSTSPPVTTGTTSSCTPASRRPAERAQPGRTQRPHSH